MTLHPLSDRMILGISIVGALVATAGTVVYVRRRRSAKFGGFGQIVGKTEAGGMTLTHHRDAKMPIEKRIKIIQDMVWQGIQDPEMRKLALNISSTCPERDGTCEAKAVYNYVKKNVRYTGDIAPIKMGADGPVEGVDLFQSAKRTLEFGGGDCLPKGTLMLVEGHRFVPIEDLIIGSKIWGRDTWTEVKDVWFKGVLPVDVIHLNNGSSFKATGEHKVYVAICPKHPYDRNKPCACPISERSIERITVAQLRPKIVMVQPDQLPYGTEEMDPRRALIEGLYLSDGWINHKQTEERPNTGDFSISGQDGCSKEEQKREVERVCAELGIPTTWQRKAINVQDKEWTLRMQQMGQHAWSKRAPSINLTKDAARALLRGIMADSGANTAGNGRTFTTTSRMLMLQVRMLQRMAGVSCGERYIVDHGGFGEHPIHRLQTRDQNRSDGHAEKLLRVREIDRDVTELPVYDLTTADHRVYLPEADVVISQCDDHAIVNSVLLALNGITPKLRVTAARKTAEFSHIYALGGVESKMRPSKFIALDTTLPGSRFGFEVPFGRNADFPA